MKNIIKLFGKEILLVIASSIICTLIMCALYSLPTDRIRNNVENSSTLYNQSENRVDNWVGYLRFGTIDNATDRTMIVTAFAREDTSIIENALLNPNYRIKDDVVDEKEGLSLRYFLDNNNIESINHYGRYWHGYLLYLIPGLMLYSVGGLRVIMLAIQFILIMLLLIKLYEINPLYSLSYAFTIIFINPITTALNFQNADVLIISLISCLFIIYKNTYIKNNRLFILFTLIGITTVFFDFLTYPIVTFGMPMITYVLINRNGLKTSIKKIVACGISWIIGYGGMWLAKWIIASIFTNENIVLDAINQIKYRSSGIDAACSDLSVFNVTFKFYESINDPSIASLIFISFIAIIIYSIIINEKLIITKNNLYLVFSILLVGISSIIWALVVRNHFISHNFLEYRTMSVFILSIYISIVLLINNNKNKY